MAEQRIISETERLAGQLRRFYQGPSWLGSSLQSLLGDIDDERAQRRQFPVAHTIWELVLHVTAWVKIARERLSATSIRDPEDAEDWPVVTGSWPDTVSALEAEIDALEKAILQFGPERLQESALAKEPQTFYVLLHGVIQHSAYHAGQIALSKK